MRRLAISEDFGAVHAIYAHDSVVPFLTHEKLDAAAFRPIFRQLIAAQDFYVFEADGAVAGFYRVTRFEGRARHVARLGSLAVAPDRQGTGIARIMVADAVERLAAEGVLRIELMAESDNARGLRFYAGLGFAVEGVQRRAYKRAADDRYTDEIVLVRFTDRSPA